MSSIPDTPLTGDPLWIAWAQEIRRYVHVAASLLNLPGLRLNQAEEPVPPAGSFRIWRDIADGNVYLMYHDPVSGVKKVELT
jgi:hypothetical protein